MVDHSEQSIPTRSRQALYSKTGCVCCIASARWRVAKLDVVFVFLAGSGALLGRERKRLSCLLRRFAEELLDPSLREDEDKAGRFTAVVLKRHPSIFRDKDERAGISVARLGIADPNPKLAVLHDQEFFLIGMAMRIEYDTRWQNLCSCHELRGPNRLRIDLYRDRTIAARD